MTRLKVSSLWAKVFVACAVIPIAAIMGKESPYCKITCDGEKHTMCLHAARDKTKCDLPAKPLTAEGKDDILKVHNEYRSKAALGRIGEKLPMASNMKKMYWSDELEEIAQRWADQCTFEHDKCRSTLDKSEVGQNLIYESSSAAFKEHTYNFKGWKDESKECSKKLVDNYGSVQPKNEVGHFTQMIWANSDELGCARSMYKKDGSNTEFLVCNYKKAGNLVGRPVYIGGNPCTNCICSKDFPGLCVKEGDTESHSNRPTPMGCATLILVAVLLCL